MNAKEIKKKYKGVKYIDTYKDGEISSVVTTHGNYVLYKDSEFATGTYEPYGYSDNNLYLADKTSYSIGAQEFTRYKVLNINNGRMVESFGYLNEPYERKGYIVCGNEQDVDSIYTKDLTLLCEVHNPEGYFLNKVVIEGSEATAIWN